MCLKRWGSLSPRVGRNNKLSNSESLSFIKAFFKTNFLCNSIEINDDFSRHSTCVAMPCEIVDSFYF